MPVSVSFEEPGRFVVDSTGNITGPEAIAALEKVRTHPRFRCGVTVLVVAHDVTSAPRTDELRDIATLATQLKSGGMAGFVIVTEPGFVYGVARMFSALADLAGVQVEVFQDLDDARNRLDEMSTHAA